MKRAVLKKIYRIGAGWLLMLLVLCSLAIPFPSKAAQIPDERLGPRLADQEELLTTEDRRNCWLGWMRSASVSNVMW